MPATPAPSRARGAVIGSSARDGAESARSATPDFIRSRNAPLAAALDADYAALGAQLAAPRHRHRARSRARSRSFGVAIPSWGVGTGGTRFARFPGVGEPRNVFEKLDDCAVIHALTGATPTVSLHLPWDTRRTSPRCKAHGDALGLGFDAVNSNTFQDQPGQRAVLQVRQPDAHRRRGARAGGRAQSRLHPHRAGARLARR